MFVRLSKLAQAGERCLRKGKEGEGRGGAKKILKKFFRPL